MHTNSAMKFKEANCIRRAFPYTKSAQFIGTKLLTSVLPSENAIKMLSNQLSSSFVWVFGENRKEKACDCLT